MKRIILVLVFILTWSFRSWSQTTTFLDITIDGTKSEMIQKLTKRGFNYDEADMWLTGKYQGRDVVLIIISNDRGLVYQLDLIFNRWTDEIKAKMLFISTYYNYFKYNSSKYVDISSTMDSYEADFLELDAAGKTSENNKVKLKIIKGRKGYTVGIFFINNNNLK